MMQGRTNNIHKRIGLMTGAVMAAVIFVFVMIFAQEVYGATSSDKTSVTIKSFTNSRITNVNIGSEIRTISNDAFNNLHSLTNISVSTDNERYASYGGCLYNKDMTELLCVPQGLSTTTFPSTMVSIGNNALKGKSSAFKQRARATALRNSENGGKIEQEKGQSESDGKTKDGGNGGDATHKESGCEESVSKGFSLEIVVPGTDFGKRIAQIITNCAKGCSSKEDVLRSCYRYVIDYGSYKRFNSQYANGWVEQYATDFLNSSQGNCSSYAAIFACLARGLGYDAHVATGYVGAIGGGVTEHAFTEVNVGGTWYIFDAELEDANGKDYYMKTYETYPSTGLGKEAEWNVGW